MAFWNRDKKGSRPLNSLSEQDIQKKLYGHFRTVETEDAPVKSSQSLKETYRRFQSERLSERLSKPESASEPTSVESQTPAQEETSEPSWNSPSQDQDLFTEAKPVSESVEKSFEPVVSSEVKPPRPAHLNPPPKQEKKPKRNRFKALSVIGAVLWTALTSIIAVLFQAGQWLKAGRGNNRRLLYWGGCVLFIFALLTSIHFLNVSREEAMKGTKKPKKPIRIEQGPIEAPAPAIKQAETTVAATPLMTPTVEQPEIKPELPAPQIPAAAEGRFVIQVATFASEGDAQRLMEAMKDTKFPVFVRDLKGASGKVYYSVFIGRFQEFRDAQKELENFRKSPTSEPFEDAFIRTLR